MNIQDLKEEIEHLDVITKNMTRRLKKLKEQKAYSGLNTRPEIDMEIEDIDAEIVTNNQKVARLKAEFIQPLVEAIEKDAEEAKNYISLKDFFDDYVERTDRARSIISIIADEFSRKYDIAMNTGVLYNTETRSNIFHEMRGYLGKVREQLDDVIDMINERVTANQRIIEEVKNL